MKFPGANDFFAPNRGRFARIAGGLRRPGIAAGRIRTHLWLLRADGGHAKARPGTGEAWQLLCDEGVGLGDTDWAPPPLAYFAAGLASSVTGAIVSRLTEQDIPAEAVSLALDNNYSLRGSILRGTMEGKGHDPDIAVTIDGGTLTDKDKSGLVL